jgi:hypothetical protein
MKQKDRYYELWLLGDSNYLNSPKGQRFIPHIYRFKTKEQWEADGFELVLNEYGHPVRDDERDIDYRFHTLIRMKPLHEKAIAAGKRFCESPESVAACFMAGVPLDEFFELPEHVENYCYARQAQESGDLVKADIHFTAAVNGNPTDIGYRRHFYQTRLKVHGVKVIPDEVNFFSNDMDSMLHSERVDEWLKALLAIKAYRNAAKLIVHVEKLLTELIDGKRGKSIYGKSSIEYLEFKKTKFIEKIGKWAKSPRYAPLVVQLQSVGWPHLNND